MERCGLILLENDGLFDIELQNLDSKWHDLPMGKFSSIEYKVAAIHHRHWAGPSSMAFVLVGFSLRHKKRHFF